MRFSELATMLGIEKIPVGIQEFLKGDEEQRKAFLSIFRHITKRELQVLIWRIEYFLSIVIVTF